MVSMRACPVSVGVIACRMAASIGAVTGAPRQAFCLWLEKALGKALWVLLGLEDTCLVGCAAGVRH